MRRKKSKPNNVDANSCKQSTPEKKPATNDVSVQEFTLESKKNGEKYKVAVVLEKDYHESTEKSPVLWCFGTIDDAKEICSYGMGIIVWIDTDLSKVKTNEDIDRIFEDVLVPFMSKNYRTSEDYGCGRFADSKSMGGRCFALTHFKLSENGTLRGFDSLVFPQEHLKEIKSLREAARKNRK
ncbi:hypothetical protein FACS189449_09400 [Alphaproteobacteria bacterium]|nr:hypothetical protein FACS189449_09400 [Alphaproteobacteria bacterium]